MENTMNTVPVFSLSLETSKVKKEIAENFCSSCEVNICKLKPIQKKKTYGAILTTKYATYDELVNLDELKYILYSMNENGFCGHNAKNNFMKIKTNLSQFDKKTNKKVDLFLLRNKIMCMKIARKNKVFPFSFDEKMHCDLAKTFERKPPILWNDLNV